MISSIFAVSFFNELSSILDFPIADCGKTSSKELEFDILFVGLNSPPGKNFVTLTTFFFR